MKSKIVTFLSILLALCMLFSFTAYAAIDSLSQNAYEALCDKQGIKYGKLLSDKDCISAGSSVSDWLAIALKANGIQDAYAAYQKSLEKYVNICYAENGRLDTAATEYHRIILTALSLGADPSRFGEKRINLVNDGIWNFDGKLGKQGLNGLIFALIAADAGELEEPENARNTRKSIIEEIVSVQEPDGGFGIVEGSSNLDITAMALQALAPYRNDHPETIDRALSYIQGKFKGAFDTVSAETVAQTVIALSALGIDAEEDTRFSNGEKGLISRIEDFVADDGTIAHSIGEDGDFMPTEQVMIAIASWKNLTEKNDGRVYGFSDMKIQREINPIITTAAIAVIAVAAATIIIIKRKNA